MADVTPQTLSVSEFNRKTRGVIEKNLLSCWIRGEVANFTRAGSGHWYFSVKDETASVKCVMFKTRNQFVEWPLHEGEAIEIRAQASFYEPRGEFQLVVDAMRKTGEGYLFEAFIKLKNRLQAEGLFAPERKKSLPAFPLCIGIVTSSNAAALNDALSVLKKRWPIAKIIIYPCLVQGKEASTQIATQIHLANKHLHADVLLLVRGGGSLEDLWAFNEERVAHAIAASALPIMSGIGHETDFTIADFVADLRAATPTAAAQSCTPDKMEMLLNIQKNSRTMKKNMQASLALAWQRFDAIQQHLLHPINQLRQQQHRLNHVSQRLHDQMNQRVTTHLIRLNQARHALKRGIPVYAQHWQYANHLEYRVHKNFSFRMEQSFSLVDALRKRLESLNPQEVLRRGYSITRTQQGEIVYKTNEVAPGEKLSITLADGKLGVKVLEIAKP